MIRSFLFFVWLFPFAFAVSPARAGTTQIQTPGLMVQVQTNGAFSIASQTPAWTFGGNTGGAISQLSYDSGTDGAGLYQRISFRFTLNGIANAASIRAYEDRPIVVFHTTILSTMNNGPLFPSISTYPQGLYKFGFQFVYGYKYESGQGPDSPWAYFDSSGNTFLVSPASHFPIAATTVDQNGSIRAGINAAIPQLPAGFTQETMLAIGSGINQTWALWGRALTDLQGKTRPAADSDITLSALSYWTDSVSKYYYSYVPQLGYEGTLRAVQRDFAQNGIPIQSMQLDSWWYPKGDPPAWNNNGNGIVYGQYVLRPDPSILPGGLNGLQNLLGGIPLLVHARWFEPDSPIRSQYQMSGNVPIDPQYWTDLAAYLKSSGVMTYEQDWLAGYARPNFNLTDPEAYLDNMAQAMSAGGITIQYCGHYVGQLLQGSKYGNLTTARVSPDGFNRAHWDDFLYNSRLTSALGIFPFADNVYSTDTRSLLLETLSAGLVGVADAIGTESAANVQRVIRSDGAIVKPDAPIVPLDSTFLADGQAQQSQNRQPPMVAYSYSDQGGIRIAYVFAYSRAADGSAASIAFTPAELGVQGPALVYNYFTQKGQLAREGSSFTDSVTTDGSYYIVAPIVGHTGMALVGDVGKFASAGIQRIGLADKHRTLDVSVHFTDGDPGATLQGYAPAPPEIGIRGGAIRHANYDPATHLFAIDVAPLQGEPIVNLSLSLRNRGDGLPPELLDAR